MNVWTWFKDWWMQQRETDALALENRDLREQVHHLLKVQDELARQLRLADKQADDGIRAKLEWLYISSETLSE